MKKVKIIILVLIIITVSAVSVLGLSRYGSRGDEVKQIQSYLKSSGYYKGNVDGIFGTGTKNAVIAFQKAKGLTPDGIVGKKTLAAMGINSSAAANSEDINLLARTISAEARGEPYAGQIAVGAVILNRVKHPSFPNTISGVIYQNGAFSCLYDGQFYEPIADSAYSAARDALNGIDPTGGCVYYYNPVTATNKWIRSLPVSVTIGRHVFCNPK